MQFIWKLVKFCIVGFSGVFVDFGITYLLKEWVRLNKYVANSLGFIAAATTNYLLNRVWTFSSTDPDVVRQYLIFIGISLIGLAINNGIIYLLNDRLRINFSRTLLRRKESKPEDKINFYCSKLLAIVTVTLWNFMMNYFFNFR